MGISGGEGAGEAAKGAGEAGAKGATDAGIAAGAGAGAGTDAALGAGALDAGSTAALGTSAAGDVAGGTLSSIGGSDLASLGAGTLATDAGGLGALGAAGTTADLGAGAAALDSGGLGAAGLSQEAGGIATTGGSSALLPEQTVLGTAPAAGGSSALGSLAAGAGSAAGLAGLASAAGGGGSGVPGTAGQPADFSGGSNPVSASTTPQFLSADDTGPSLGTLSPDLAQSLGVSPDLTSNFVDPSLAGDNPGFGPLDVAGPSATDSIGSWFENPKNIGTAGLLGLSLKNALSQPKLPGASSTANAAATEAVKGATSVIQSGGTATPEWASQKATIDQTFDQQIKQQSEALQQAAASSGEGNQNSGIVQQQIAQMTANVNVQRQQAYAQAQQQNVQAALSELAGGDQTLTSIGNMQLAQSEQAQQLAAQTAEM